MDREQELNRINKLMEGFINITTMVEALVPRGDMCRDCNQINIITTDNCNFFRRVLAVDDNGNPFKCCDCKISCARKEGIEACNAGLSSTDNPYSLTCGEKEHLAWDDGLMSCNL